MATMTPLRKHRALRDLTQARLAGLAGVDASTVGKAERGVPVSPLVKARLARALGVTLEELFPETLEETVA